MLCKYLDVLLDFTYMCTGFNSYSFLAIQGQINLTCNECRHQSDLTGSWTNELQGENLVKRSLYYFV